MELSVGIGAMQGQDMSVKQEEQMCIEVELMF